MKRHRPALHFILAATLGLFACAAPSLSRYTLQENTTINESALPAAPIVVEIERVAIPDELDTEDILVRDGNTLRRSRTGRWASRLSLQASDLITQILANRYANALITDQRQAEPPTFRVFINIQHLDIRADGTANIAADWIIVPHDPNQPTRRDRMSAELNGPVATDKDVVALEKTALLRLADAVSLSPPL